MRQQDRKCYLTVIFVPMDNQKKIWSLGESCEARHKPHYIRTAGLSAGCKVHIICRHGRRTRGRKEKKKCLRTFLHLFGLFKAQPFTRHKTQASAIHFPWRRAGNSGNTSHSLCVNTSDIIRSGSRESSHCVIAPSSRLTATHTAAI